MNPAMVDGFHWYKSIHKTSSFGMVFQFLCSVIVLLMTSMDRGYFSVAFRSEAGHYMRSKPYSYHNDLSSVPAKYVLPVRLKGFNLHVRALMADLVCDTQFRTGLPLFSTL